MRRLLLFLICLGGVVFQPSIPALAQNEAPPVMRSVTAPTDVDTLLANGRIDGKTPLDISITQAQLQAAQATAPLQQWVQSGGVALVHTDAARLFGFETVKPRERTHDRAGLRWGRARNVLPFGAHPLLWGASSEDETSLGVPGVHTVFYHLEDNEVLISNPGNGTPLLRVEDPTVEPGGAPPKIYYLAAARRYGQGWVIFAPSELEKRGDGEQFEANLTHFIADAQAGKWLTLPSSALVDAYQERQSTKWNALRKSLHQQNLVNEDEPQDGQPADALAPQAEPAEKTVVRSEVEVPIPLDEAKILESVWKTATPPDGAPENQAVDPEEQAAQARANGLLFILLARLSWQSDSDNGPAQAPSDVAALWNPIPVARLALFNTELGGEAETLTRWWEGALALGAALPPVPTQREANLYPFSYAAPAQEAATWWSGQGLPQKGGDGGPGNLTTRQSWPVGLTVPQVNQDVLAARKMVDLHKNDPQLMSSWVTQGGTRYYMQLAPIQALSPKFPPSPQEWGVPTLQAGTDNFKVLVPFGSGNSISINGLSNPVIGHPANAMRTDMFWRCSSIWSDEIAETWGYHEGEVHLQLFPIVPSIVVIGGNAVQPSFSESFPPNASSSQPHFEDGVIKYREKLFLPLASLEAHLRQTRVSPGGVMIQTNPMPIPKPVPPSDDEVSFGYFTQLAMDFSRMDQWNFLIPARMSRLTSHQMLSSTLMGRDDPDLQWIDDGLQNLFSIGMADFINREPAGLPDIVMPPPPALANQFEFRGYKHSSDSIELEAKTYSFAAAAPSDGEMGEEGGDNLDTVQSTKMMSFFYEEYGMGAVQEVLQRIGAGATFDAALQATTGDTKAQFMEKFAATK